MKYRLTADFHDERRTNLPPIEVDVDATWGVTYKGSDMGYTLGDLIVDELCNDYEQPFGAPFSLLIERLDKNASPFGDES